MTIDLQPGDVFCVRGNGLIPWLIVATEKFWSIDNEARYGHSGIITSAAGETIEALWVVEPGHLDRYTGHHMLIARPTMTIYRDSMLSDKSKAFALELISKHLGRWYPLWRIGLHLIPPAAKYLASGRWLVCSELVAKYLTILAARHLPYSGVSPDTLADEWRNFRNIDVIYEGVWPEKPTGD